MTLDTTLFLGDQPTIPAARVRLRALRAADATRAQALLRDEEVAKQTLNIPHPYPESEAERWIAEREAGWRAGKMLAWAIALEDSDLLVGAISLKPVPAHLRAEVGYWVARELWGQGIGTAALRAILAWGFDTLGLHRIEAHHFGENPASGRIMIKAGMRHEGRVREPIFRDGVPRDLELYGMLRSDPRPV
jgi:RimJ/RimL family protein N-acetyltransferase